MVNVCLRSRADATILDKQGHLPFGLALRQNPRDTALIEKFLLYGCRLGSVQFLQRFEKGEVLVTPLLNLFVLRVKDLELYEWYLGQGCSVNEADEAGNDCLAYAVLANSRKLASFVLRQKGYQIGHRNRQGWNALHHAVQPFSNYSFENCAMVRHLSKAGIDINALEQAGRSPLDYA